MKSNFHVSANISAVLLTLLLCSCMGSYHSARVVPFRIGGTVYSCDESDAVFAGVAVDGGWPAGPGRFGTGLHGKICCASYEDDTATGFAWGGRVQFPENAIADFAVEQEFWIYVPAITSLIVSRDFGLIEPYAHLGLLGLVQKAFDDNDLNDIFGGGYLSITAGALIPFGSRPGLVLAAEIETGPAWETPGIGLGLFWEN